MQVLKSLRERWDKNWPEFRCACTGGFPSFVFQRRPKSLGANLPVFCYHVVDRASFHSDLSFLKRNDYQTLDADALLRHLRGERQAEERSVLLSFDDGPRNLYNIVFPLLKSFGMNAVAFLSTKFHPHEAGISKSKLRDLPCTWSQVREMHESGCFDFQSHTHEHRYIPRWPEPLRLIGSELNSINKLRGSVLSIEEDFLISKEILDHELGKSVQHLAFPMYQGNKTAIEKGVACGYIGFWWGTLPWRPGNAPGDPATHIVRLSGEFVRCLPGHGRVSLAKILSCRYSHRSVIN